MTTRLFAPLTASALAWLLFTGCSSTEPEVEPVDTTGAAGEEMPGNVFSGEGAVPPAPEDVEGEVTLSDPEIEFIKQLPAEDIDIAMAQKVCPVSDEHLGSMGLPIKVDANGTPIFVCCAGCKGEVEENPEEYLAKVSQGSTDEAPEPEGEGEGS